MNSTTFYRLLFSYVILSSATVGAVACGPYAPLIPTPEFFAHSRPPMSIAESEREENIRLWQSLTSQEIPLKDIEDAVYHDSRDCFMDHKYNSGNLFYTYLNNSGDVEIEDFLMTAKWLEERRETMCSPWYYPRERNSCDGTDDFKDIIDICMKYPGTRLKDRYALQIVRALFASRQYGDCVEYYDSVFTAIPDGNLMKRMALRYVAGCWSRIGDTQRADSIFAEAGDIRSISGNDPVVYMAQHNPNAPQLMVYIRSNAADTAFMKKVKPIAERFMQDRKITNGGDWGFLAAYCNSEFEDNVATARRQLYRALQHRFSTDELHDLARAYKMKLDAKTGNRQSLLTDLRWIERKTGNLNPDAHQWKRRIRNIIYVDLVPALWRNKDYSTAILLCSYADNIAPAQEMHTVYESIDGCIDWSCDHSITPAQMRDSEKYCNDLDYGCLSFQMMGSLTSTQLAHTYTRIMGSDPLYAFLRRKARTDSDYFNELIGTLALREENYPRAISYLYRVSRHYQRTMNIFKEGYLSHDPFKAYPSRWETESWGDEYEHRTACYPPISPTDAKLEFAKKMYGYSLTMKFGKNDDERGLARLMYAIGRRNSFETCWALTQYWRGETGIFYPNLQYWEDDFAAKNYNFLYDYNTTVGHHNTESIYDREISAARAMLTSREARAQAEYILGNLKTVVKWYGNTATAELIMTSCDNWKCWL